MPSGITWHDEAGSQDAAKEGTKAMKRRTFLGAVAALVGLPWVKTKPDDDPGSFVIPVDFNSEFLESRQFTVTELCRWYAVPPHIVRPSDET